MEGPLSFICSIGKTVFSRKLETNRSLASFTKIGPGTCILWCKYCHNSVASHLLISSAPRSERRHVKEREE